MPKNKKSAPYRSFNSRRFYYNGLEIYIPFSSNRLYINGREIMRVTCKKLYDICTEEGQAHIIDELKKRGFIN